MTELNFFIFKRYHSTNTMQLQYKSGFDLGLFNIKLQMKIYQQINHYKSLNTSYKYRYRTFFNYIDHILKYRFPIILYYIYFSVCEI